MLQRRQNDHAFAQEKFHLLTRHPETALLGMSALLALSLQNHSPLVTWNLYEQWPHDLKLSTFFIKKIIDVALELHKFDEARYLLAQLKKQKSMSSLEIHHHESKIALKYSYYARNVLKNNEAAYVSAQEAYNADPTVDASYNIISYLIEYDKLRKAKEIIRNLWQQQPSLSILPYLAAIEPEYTSIVSQYALLKKWSEQTSDQTEKFLTLALLALKAGLWGECQTWLENIFPIILKQLKQ